MVADDGHSWGAALPRGEAMYGFWDGGPTCRQPRRAFALLPGGPAVAPSAKSGLRQGTWNGRAYASSRQFYRHPFQPDMRAASLIGGAISKPPLEGQGCMAHVLNTWTGRLQSAEQWDDELSRAYNMQAPQEAVGRSVGAVVAAAYGFAHKDGRTIDICNDPARVILTLMANLEAAVVEIVCEDPVADDDAPDDVIADVARRTLERQEDWSSRDIQDRISAARLRGAKENAPVGVGATSRIHPLKSLSGMRATATGAYAVAVRMGDDHVEPLFVQKWQASGAARCLPALFWGNNACAIGRSAHFLFESPLWLSPPHAAAALTAGVLLAVVDHQE